MMKSKKMYSKDPNKTYCDNLFARVPVEKVFYWVPVELKRQNPVAIEGATSYLYRRMTNGVRKTVSLGKDLAYAFVQWRNLESDAERVKQGKAPIYTDTPESVPARVQLAVAAAEYLAELPTLDKAPATITAYTNAVNDFVRSCPKTFIDEIERKDMINYIAWMRTNLQKRKFGEQNRTIRNRLIDVGTWLRRHKVTLKKRKGADADAPGLLFATDIPKTTKKQPDMYSTKTINALLAAAKPNEQFLIEFFLYTGCRDEEVAHMEWDDFNEDGKFVRVQPKPHFNWRVKGGQVRDIDRLPSAFLKKLIEQRDSRPDQKCNLIFPSSVCKPDKHLIKIIQKVARKAKLTERVTLHRFRRTFGTRMAKKFGLATAMRLGGWENIETIASYLSAEDMTPEEAQTTADEAFSDVLVN
jgi:integrase